MIREPVSHETSSQLYVVMHLINIVDHSVYNFSFEWLEYDRSVSCHEFCLPTPTEDHAFSDVKYWHHGDDVTELARAGALNIRVKFGF